MTANVVRTRGRQVLKYLDEHRLDHTPEHYAFAYRLLFGEDAALTRAVATITDGGVRIGPKEVEQLAPMLSSSARSSVEVGPKLDALTLKVLDIAQIAAGTTGELSRDLVTAMAVMLAPDGRDLRSTIATMINKTAAAQASLGEASRRAEALRGELNALRDGGLRDKLTGLLNRQGMEERLAKAGDRPTGFSVALIQIDRFATFNKRYGAAVGERVLKVIAGALDERCSPHLVARWDGETFMILFEKLTAAEAARVVEGTRAAMAGRHLQLRENDEPLGMISFSAGVASCRSRDLASLLEATSSLLQQAIRQGGNTVVVEQAAVGV
jgi:diguanylate cyclase